MEYVRFFAAVVWYTLGAIVLCGLGISLCRTWFLQLLGRPGRGVVLATSIIGTPIHELGHALMCLLFGHRITRMRLWSPASTDGTLGSVTHQYSKRNPYQVLGLLFIGVGPILLGAAVLTLTLRLCFPAALAGYAEATSALLADHAGAGAVLVEGLALVPRLLRELFGASTVPVWGRVIGVILLLSVSLHMELSPADIRGFARALPLYGGLVLLLTVICGLIGPNSMATVSEALAGLSAYMVALFAVVFAAVAVELAVAIPIGLLRRTLRRH